MINRWTIKLWINNLTIQIPSLNYNNTYIEDSKYWNILLLSFSLFNQNQSFKDNSNSIKPNTYIHMNMNSKNKSNNLRKPLPNTVTIYLFIYFQIMRFVRTYVIHLLGTYVNILCNWLILWQNTLYLYLGKFRTCLNTSRNHVSRSSVEAFKSVQENKLKM